MFNQYSYKQKNTLLSISAVFILILIYWLGIKKTIENYLQYNKNKDQMVLVSNAPASVLQLKQELMEINSKLGNQNINEQNNTDKLIELVTNYCKDNQVVLMEFPQTETKLKDDLLIETNKFTISGNFVSLLKLVYLLEQKSNLGKVTSVYYKMIKNYKSKELILTAKIYLQNIKKKDNEN